MADKRVMLLRNSSRNLKVRDSTAYTEDNVPVYNVVIHKLPRNTKLALVTEHFAKFGQIKDVQIVYGKTRSTATQCVISYQDTDGAGAALKQRCHTLNYQRVFVKACPSWEQPFQIRDPPPDAETSILSLNDYCLEMIFRRLDLKHQIRLSLCHPRLEQVFAHMICSRLKRHLNLSQLLSFSSWEMRQIFRTAGPFLESIEVGQDFPNGSAATNIYAFMHEHCRNIRSMKVVCRSFIHVSFLNALRTSIITELELYQCNLYDSDLKPLRSLYNLQTLGLACNRNLSGQYLPQLRKVQRLSLYQCHGVRSDALVACCQALKLRYLDVRCTDSLRHLATIVDHCGELETLKISRGCNSDGIVKLPKLKSLEVHHWYGAMPSNFYNALAEYHADNLEELKLTGHMYTVFPTVALSIARLRKLRVLWLGGNKFNVLQELLKLISNLTELEEINLNFSARMRDEHLLPMIRQFTKLKRINLCKCPYITESLVWSAIEILQKRTLTASQTPQPLVLLVYGTRIKREILQNQQYLSSCHLLKLLFHADIPARGYINEESAFDISDNDFNCRVQDDDVNTENDVEEDYEEYGEDEYGDGDGDIDADENDEIDNMDIFFIM